jgi:hypothetical protein
MDNSPNSNIIANSKKKKNFPKIFIIFRSNYKKKTLRLLAHVYNMIAILQPYIGLSTELTSGEVNGLRQRSENTNVWYKIYFWKLNITSKKSHQ